MSLQNSSKQKLETQHLGLTGQEPMTSAVSVCVGGPTELPTVLLPTELAIRDKQTREPLLSIATAPAISIEIADLQHLIPPTAGAGATDTSNLKHLTTPTIRPFPSSISTPEHIFQERHPQFSLGRSRTTSPRWPFVTIAVISTTQLANTEVESATVIIVPTNAPTNIKARVYGEPCSNEGQWLCLGSTYQRCASGHWSQVMPLAQGMSCALYGIGSDILINGGSSGEQGFRDAGISCWTINCNKRLIMLGLLAVAVFGGVWR